MATSFTRKVFDGTSDRIPIAFPYLDKSHVQVYLNDVLQSPTTYSWPTSGEIKLNAVPANGTVGYAPRKTPDEAITVFAPGNLDPNDLNVATLQPLFLAAEARDGTTDFFMRAWVSGNFATGGTITKSPEGYVATFDALGNLIGTFDGGDISAAQGYSLAAKDWRDQALGFRNEAEAFKNTASQKATDAAQSAVDAANAVGPAIRDSALKSSMADDDRFGIWDTVGSALKSITLAQVIARIFQTTRKIANANFLSSFRLWDSTVNTKGMAFDLTAVTAGQTRSLKMPDADVDLANVGVSEIKAWVNFNGTGIVAVRAGRNISGVTDNGVGDYIVNFINPMPDANFIALGLGSGESSSSGGVPRQGPSFSTAGNTATSCRVKTGFDNGSATDWDTVGLAFIR